MNGPCVYAVAIHGFRGVLLALNAYTKNYSLGEIAEKHRQAAAELWFIREKYLSLLADIRVGRDALEVITNRRGGPFWVNCTRSTLAQPVPALQPIGRRSRPSNIRKS